VSEAPTGSPQRGNENPSHRVHGSRVCQPTYELAGRASNRGDDRGRVERGELTGLDEGVLALGLGLVLLGDQRRGDGHGAEHEGEGDAEETHGGL
jgi:hypothetical protein